jgi:NADH dehydrogenase
MRSDYFQGWADSVDFFEKTITVEEAVDDPQLGLSRTGSLTAENSITESNKAKKGKLFNLPYDKLVIAVGCYSQTFDIPGVKEHAMFLKDVGDAQKIRQRILACFEIASLPITSEQMRKYLLNFAIVGGGPTGVEFASGSIAL